MLAGCSISMPMLGSEDEPATTGSIAAPVDVQQPLPKTLAYSDATKIGQAAAATLWQAGGSAEADWVNAATGSSGTLANATGSSDECRPFSTIVTSFAGVHSYSGNICRAGDGRSVVRIDERSPQDRS